MGNVITEPKVKSWTTEKDGEKIVHVQIERLEPSAFFAGGCGNSFAEALMRAAVTFYNRECQEFNAVEIEKQEKDKNNYGKRAEEKYHARRREPVATMTTGALLELAMFCDSVRISNQQMSRVVKDNQTMVDLLRAKIDAVPFKV